MKLRLAVFISVAACALAAQSPIPRIGGEWTVVAAKSPGYGGGADVLTLTVQQSEAEVALKLGRGETTRYPIGAKTDLDPKTWKRVTALAEWHDGQFVVKGEREALDGAVTSYQILVSLDSDGELVMERREFRVHSESTSKLVFARSSQDK
jgi:hypothetical protein